MNDSVESGSGQWRNDAAPLEESVVCKHQPDESWDLEFSDDL